MCQRCGDETLHWPDGRCSECVLRAGRQATLFAEAGITERHGSITTWDSLAADILAHTAAVSDVRAFLADPEGSIFAIIGKRGTGKTQIGVVAVAETIRTQAQPARRVHLLDLLGDLKRRITDADPEGDWARAWVRPVLLVIDEITHRLATDWTALNLQRLLDRRYEQMRKTILIGNITESELPAVLGPSTSDRLNEAGGVIVCEWPSFRGRVGATP